MKYVRLFVLALAAVVFVAPAAIAQGGGGGGGGQSRGGRGLQFVMQNITLTAEQQAKFDSIAAKYQELRSKLPAFDPNADSTARAAAMQQRGELSQKQYDEIRGLLTADQQKVFDENRKNLPTGRRGGGSGGR
jgi:Spy/CpxP family protein refolding chaperone